MQLGLQHLTVHPVCKHFHNFHFLGSENQQLAIEVAARVLPQLLRLCRILVEKDSNVSAPILPYLHICILACPPS